MISLCPLFSPNHFLFIYVSLMCSLFYYCLKVLLLFLIILLFIMACVFIYEYIMSFVNSILYFEVYVCVSFI